MRTGKLTASFDRHWYPEHGDNWDDTLLRERVLSLVSPESRILDLGAGAGIVKQMNFRGRVAQVSGIDLDPRVSTNPFLDEGVVGSAEVLPWSDRQFDLVVADNVFEHLSDPLKVMREVNRVLRPGGWFLIKTPNKWHYVPLIARLTPHGFHAAVNRLRGRATADTFATLYRANSRGAMRRLAAATGFEVSRLSLIEGRPEYMRITALTYLFGYLYERVVNSSGLFATLRILLLAELRKPR